MDRHSDLITSITIIIVIFCFSLDYKFTIQFFNDSRHEEKMGKAVMIYVYKDGRKMVVCCSDSHDIEAEAMVSRNKFFKVISCACLPLKGRTVHSAFLRVLKWSCRLTVPLCAMQLLYIL